MNNFVLCKMIYDIIFYLCDVNYLNDIVGFGRYSNVDYFIFFSVFSAV